MIVQSKQTPKQNNFGQSNSLISIVHPQTLVAFEADLGHRGALDEALEKYVQNHYSDGVCAVYAARDENYPTPPVVVVVDSGEEGVEFGAGVDGTEVEKEEGVVVDSEDKEEVDSTELKSDETPLEISSPISEPTVDTPTTPKTPAVVSRIFSLHFVGNKYNPGNYWFVSRFSHHSAVD